jgi:hypothetical protein
VSHRPKKRWPKIGRSGPYKDEYAEDGYEVLDGRELCTHCQEVLVKMAYEKY